MPYVSLTGSGEKADLAQAAKEEEKAREAVGDGMALIVGVVAMCLDGDDKDDEGGDEESEPPAVQPAEVKAEQTEESFVPPPSKD